MIIVSDIGLPFFEVSSRNGGYIKIDELGIERKLFEDVESGFKAVLYRSEDGGKFVLAFAGTVDLLDWGANLTQGAGALAKQYEQAIELAGAVRDKVGVGGDSLELTGHSLGGGLAAAAAIATGTKATTFNSAGVHFNTYTRVVGIESVQSKTEAGRNVVNYYVPGEFLTAAQTVIPSIPSALGEQKRLSAVSGDPVASMDPVGLHKIGSVIAAIDAKIRSVEKRISGFK